MTILDKLKFWKKDDGFDESFGADDNLQGNDFLPPQGQQESSQPEAGFPQHDFPQTPTFASPQPSQPSFASAPAPHQGSHDLEVVSAKLDMLKAMLESINQRLASLERVAYQESSDQKKYWR